MSEPRRIADTPAGSVGVTERGIGGDLPFPLRFTVTAEGSVLEVPRTFDGANTWRLAGSRVDGVEAVLDIRTGNDFNTMRWAIDHDTGAVFLLDVRKGTNTASATLRAEDGETRLDLERASASTSGAVRAIAIETEAKFRFELGADWMEIGCYAGVPYGGWRFNSNLTPAVPGTPSGDNAALLEQVLDILEMRGIITR